MKLEDLIVQDIRSGAPKDMTRTPFNCFLLMHSTWVDLLLAFNSSMILVHNIFLRTHPRFQAILESDPRCARNVKAARGSDLNRSSHHPLFAWHHRTVSIIMQGSLAPSPISLYYTLWTPAAFNCLIYLISEFMLPHVKKKYLGLPIDVANVIGHDICILPQTSW